jgi:hypothetical protein
MYVLNIRSAGPSIIIAQQLDSTTAFSSGLHGASNPGQCPSRPELSWGV